MEVYDTVKSVTSSNIILNLKDNLVHELILIHNLSNVETK